MNGGAPAIPIAKRGPVRRYHHQRGAISWFSRNEIVVIKFLWRFRFDPTLLGGINYDKQLSILFELPLML